MTGEIQRQADQFAMAPHVASGAYNFEHYWDGTGGRGDLDDGGYGDRPDPSDGAHVHYSPEDMEAEGLHEPHDRFVHDPGFRESGGGRGR